MTQAEALKKLALLDESWSINEDPQEAIDQQLFVYKNFFLSKIALAKIFKPKIERLKQLQEIVETLKLDFKPQISQKAIHFQGEMINVFNQYQEQRNQLKSWIMTSKHALEIAAYANQLVELQKKYAAFWNKEEDLDENILVSLEPDTMNLLEALRQYATNGGLMIEQLKKGENNPAEILLLEQKRLSLLFQKY